MNILYEIQWRTVGQRIGGGGGTEWKSVCCHCSVASFLVLGGGKDPQMYRQKITYTARASASETYTFRTQNTSAYIYNQCIFLYLWYGAINDIILTKH